MKLMHVWAAAAFAASVAGVPPAQAAREAAIDWDTTTGLKLEWAWVVGDLSEIGSGQSFSTYSSPNWEVELDVSKLGDWHVEARYKHLAGPHGENAETQWHVHSIDIRPGVTIAGSAISGTEDHDASPTGHALAHQWALSGNGADDTPDFHTFATLQVTHVPESANWALMAAGVAALRLWRRRGR